MIDLRNRFFALLAAIVIALLFLLPTFFRSAFEGSQWISKPLSLGLDLSGGVHLVYEVQGEEAVKSRLQSIGNSLRTELREAKMAVVKAKSTDARQLELLFLNQSVAERAKVKIQEINRELQFVQMGSEGERAKLIYGVTDAYADKVKKDAMNQAVETLRNRVDQFGVAEPLIQRIGDTRITLQMPGVSDVSSVKKVVGNVAKLEFRLLPVGGKSDRTVVVKDKAGVSIDVEDEALMTGDAVDTAKVSFDDQGQTEVLLNLTKEGGSTFRKITSENIGRNLAIILDGVLYSSPTIRSAISGGSASISGGFTPEEARQLAVVLRAGALPAPLKVVEERSVGPTLGAESIKKGVLAIVSGFILVALFMIFFYKKSGLVAVTSLVLNLFFILAILSAFGATLTLPGLAALALTVGVAVDSNVLVFERIKDELWNGAGRDSAVKAGFDKAYTAILDSNLAAFFTGFILYMLGTGPIKGFAVSLCVGIITTVFCAVFVARIIFDYFQLKGGKFGLSI